MPRVKYIPINKIKRTFPIDWEIWIKLRGTYPKLGIMKYFLLYSIYHKCDIKLYDEEFEEWIGIVRNPEYVELDTLTLAYCFHVDCSTITRHLVSLRENGLILKSKDGVCLSTDIKMMFENSSNALKNDNILIFDSILTGICKSVEEALVMSYILKKLTGKNIGKINISEIRKYLSLDPKTIKSALTNLDQKSFIKFYKESVYATYFEMEIYKSHINEFIKIRNTHSSIF